MPFYNPRRCRPAIMFLMWLGVARRTECGFHNWVKHHLPHYYDREDTKAISIQAIPIEIPLVMAPPTKGWPAPAPAWPAPAPAWPAPAPAWPAPAPAWPAPAPAWPAPAPAWPAPAPAWPPPKGKMPWNPKIKKMNNKLKKMNKWVKKLKKEVKKIKKCAKLPPCDTVTTPAPNGNGNGDGDGDVDYENEDYFSPNMLAPVFVMPPKMTMVVKHVSTDSKRKPEHQRYKRQSQKALIRIFKKQLNRNLDTDKTIGSSTLIKPVKLFLNDLHHTKYREDHSGNDHRTSSKNSTRQIARLKQHKDEMMSDVLYQPKNKIQQQNISKSSYNRQKITQPQRNMTFPARHRDEKISAIHHRQKRAIKAMLQNGRLCCPNGGGDCCPGQNCCGSSDDDWEDGWDDDDWEEEDEEEEEEEGWDTKQRNHYMRMEKGPAFSWKGDSGLYGDYDRSRDYELDDDSY